MRRDMNLIRLTLLEIEGEEPKADLSAYSSEQQTYHSALLIDAGLIRGHVLRDHKGEVRTAIGLDLTWEGHEFLAAARNDTIWKKTIEKLKATGLDATLTVLKELLSNALKAQFPG